MTQTFKDHFSAHADDYATSRPVYPAALAAALAARAGERTLAVDLGCGSGQLSILLAEHFATVAAIDASAEQVAHAKRCPGVGYLVAPAERTPLPAQSTDLIVASQSVHWFDLPAFWAEVARIGRTGSLVALVGYERLRICEALDPVLLRFHDETLRDFWPPERWSLVNGYADIAIPYPEEPAPELEMTACWSLSQLLRYVATWSGVKAAELAGHATMTMLADELTPRWGDPDRRLTVRWPLVIRLARISPRREIPGG